MAETPHELFIFARFHAAEDKEEGVAAAIREVILQSRAEPGCRGIEGHRSLRDGRLFYIHSRWVDEAAFEIHAGLPHTVRFIGRMATLVDQPLEVTRARPFV
jgi:quinol monooxygenase YgiN